MAKKENNELVDKSVKTYIFALGGLNEVGKNTYVIEHGQNIIIIDAGVKFPESEFPGVDYVIPDYTYLIKNRSKIKALFITHGHEDHIGGIPFLLQNIDIPVIYASKLTAGLIKNKLDEHGMSQGVVMEEIDHNSKVNIGPLSIEFFSTTHSIPDSLGLIIDSPNGRIVSTGDFKIDLTPLGQEFDLAKIANVGEKGVTLYMADSTNAEVEGLSKSERVVAKSLKEIFKEATGRIIIATFSSNVHRIQQIIESAVKFNRKILVFGRSMENAIATGRKLGYIKCPDNFIYDLESDNVSPYQNLNELLILCTGSQGEPMAALSRIANNSHRYIKIIPGDTVIFSSNPIPGNLAPVNKIVNLLAKNGADVIVNSALYSIHTSGHAQKEELKIMLKLVKPKYFMPMHGEYRMLKLHGLLASSMGVNKDNIFVLENGEMLVMSKGVVSRGKKIEAENVYIDGKDITGVENAVINDRKILSNDGLIAVVVPIDSKNNMMLKPPSIVSRGFIYLKERGDLLIEAEKVVHSALLRLMKTGKVTFSDIKKVIKDSASKFVYDRTNRYPVIIPVILNKREVSHEHNLSQ